MLSQPVARRQHVARDKVLLPGGRGGGAIEMRKRLLTLFLVNPKYSTEAIKKKLRAVYLWKHRLHYQLILQKCAKNNVTLAYVVNTNTVFYTFILLLLVYFFARVE